MEIKVNRHGVNTKIQYHNQTESIMREHKFTDRREGYWYRLDSVGDNITLNISFPKEDGQQDELDIAVLDEDFLQPWDYQHLLSKHPDFKPALEIKDKVETIIAELTDAGILSGHETGEYI